jgi:hypothetical protein
MGHRLLESYLVTAPAADDRRREVLGDAAHGHPHLIMVTKIDTYV